MFPSKIISFLAVVLAPATFLGLGATPLARAAPGSPGDTHAQNDRGENTPLPDASPDVVLHTVDNTDEVAEYWTEERMQKAIPLAVEAVGEDLPQGEPTPEARPSGPDIVPPVPPPGEAGNGPRTITNAPPSIGKVFFTSGEKDLACSGAAVTSKYKTVVLTAGHCIHGGQGQKFYTKWIFVPSYDKGKAPYGKYPLTSSAVLEDWIAYGNSKNDKERYRAMNSDIAFVKVKSPKGKKPLEDVVGAQGLWWSESNDSVYVDVLGYSAKIGKGEVMSACTRVTVKVTLPPYPMNIAPDCETGDGWSGGPWLKDYNNKTQLGYVYSLTAFSRRGKTVDLGGPRMHKQARSVYDKL